MVWAVRNLWRSSSPASSKTGLLEQFKWDHVQESFEYFQRSRLRNRSGQPVPVLSHPQSKAFPQIQIDPLVFLFVPTVLSVVTTEKSLAPLS